MIRAQLKSRLVTALSEKTALPEAEIATMLEQPRNKDHGDLAFPCFKLAKMWGMPPVQCAAKLQDTLKELPAGYSTVEPAGPFLNFRFARSEFVSNVVGVILSEREKYGSKQPRTARVVLEYSSPNIAKPFHVGHLRNTLIGHCLDRTYRFSGYDVVTVNHLGDWGTQFGFVYAGCELFGKPEKPTVHALVALYKKASVLKEEQETDAVAEEEKHYPNVNELARGYFLDLEAQKPYAVEFWKWCLDISMQYFAESYRRLDIQFDHNTGESFYVDKLDTVKADLERAGILKESQGALGVDLGEELGFARIYTPDGRSLYLARDLATAKYRAETFKFEKCVYVVGVPQTLHFKQIVGVAKALGAPYADKLIHVPYGTVLGMKTRGPAGVVEMNDLLDEGKTRAQVAYNEQVQKRPEGIDEEEVAEAVGLAAIVYGNLSRTKIKDVEFKWEQALAFSGDSGPYLLYAYARINGIKEKAEGVTASAKIDGTLLPEESAYHLCITLERFESVLDQVVEENEPFHLASYALDVAFAVSKAYLDLKVVGVEKELAVARMSLFESARVVLGSALHLLGMRVVERM